MRRLSQWAKMHPVYARLLIIISRILLAGIAVFMARQLFLSGILLPASWLYLFILLFIVTALVYPKRTAGKKPAGNYFRRKTCDWVVAFCGFGIFTCCANQSLFNKYPLSEPVMATMTILDPAYKNAEAKKLLDAYAAGERTHFNRKEKRILKNEFGFQLKQYAKATLTGHKKSADTAGLIILSIIAAAGLLYLVAALACTLSCNGSDVGAVIVALLGTAAIILGLVAVIKAIKKSAGRKKKRQRLPLKKHLNNKTFGLRF